MHVIACSDMKHDTHTHQVTSQNLHNMHHHSHAHAYTHTHTHTQHAVQLYAGASFNLIGSVIRIISTIGPVVCSPLYSKSGFMVALIGQILTACAQPFLLYSPTTLAAVWFGPKERAVCTNLASIGVCICVSVFHLPL